MSTTREESTRLGFTPIRLTWTPSVANSRAYRLEKPIAPGACAPLPSSPGTSTASGQTECSLEFPITGLLSRSPRPSALLAQAGKLSGPLHALPRDGESDPLRPRCLLS